MLHYIDTDHDNPAVKALLEAAAEVDDRLPAAWGRVGAYLEAYGEETGKLGSRPLDGDHIATLTVQDLHTLIDGLEALLNARATPAVPTVEGATAEEGVFYAEADLRAHVEQLAEDALTRAAETPPDSSSWGPAAEAVTAAVWGTIEQMGFIGAAALARELAQAHTPGCHGRTVAEALAAMMIEGDGAVHDVSPCAAGPDGVGLGDLAGLVQEVLEHVTPLPTVMNGRGDVAPEGLAALKDKALARVKAAAVGPR